MGSPSRVKCAGGVRAGSRHARTHTDTPTRAHTYTHTLGTRKSRIHVSFSLLCSEEDEEEFHEVKSRRHSLLSAGSSSCECQCQCQAAVLLRLCDLRQQQHFGRQQLGRQQLGRQPSPLARGHMGVTAGSRAHACPARGMAWPGPGQGSTLWHALHVLGALADVAQGAGAVQPCDGARAGRGRVLLQQAEPCRRLSLPMTILSPSLQNVDSPSVFSFAFSRPVGR